MDNVQRESFTGMIQLLENVLNNNGDCVVDGTLERFLEALADFNASRFYALSEDEIPWMHRQTEPTIEDMESILFAYGIDVNQESVCQSIVAARDYFISEYRKAVYRFQSE